MVAIPRQRAFTLVELLVIISIIAILLAITLPALMRTRDTATETSELSLNRQSGLTIAAYAADHDGEFPYYGVRGTDFAPLRYHDGPRAGEFVYGPYGWHWMQQEQWAYFVIGKGYDAMSAVIRPESRTPLSATALAAPRYFADAGGSVSDHGPQRIHLVAYPSRKGLLRRQNYRRLQYLVQVFGEEELERRADGVPVFVWFADGHSALHAPADMQPSVPVRGLYALEGAVLSTRHGILGRDL